MPRKKKIEEKVSQKTINDFELSAENRLMRIINEPAEKGVQLSSGIDMVCTDISAISTEKWEKLRSVGIGGSDAGVIYGTNHYKDIEVLAREKLGLLPKQTVDWKTQARFDMGHLAEKVISKMFSELTGFKVMEDRAMYRHSAYPCMIADVDGVAIDKQGLRVGIEYKFINPDDLKFKWASGVYGQDAKTGNESYITQCRHYMSVLNVDRYYICVWAGNNADDLVVIRVDRDFDIEKELISKEVEFWNNIQNGIIPVLSSHTKVNDNLLTSGMTFPLSNPSKSKDIVIDGAEGDKLSETAAEYLKNAQLKASLNAKIKAIDEKQNALSEVLKKEMSDKKTAALKVEGKGGSYNLSVSSTSRTSADCKKLKIRYPNLYSQLEAEELIKTTKAAPSLKVKEETVIRR